ncbi:MAG: TetR/AcrR family transcriptional regulator [Microvirga sp.]|uniref:TetR/AcrR family transcriptional regulator n=1 Tax=Methylobacterium sp. GXS13 TaxID=1730094 RepID=UPI00128F3CE3|nr:TetR/AcrR family transcriptional regulator [Methylobacterium sp. GXS13]
MNRSMSSAAVVDQKMPRGPIPRGARRRGEIARAAEQVFLQYGFADTTMKMVALAAGASKETLYRHFGSKEDLFLEIVNNRNNEVRQTLDAELESDRPIPIILRSVGISLLECMCSPTVVALARIIVNETPRYPALGDAFYAMAPGRTLQKLTRYLTDAKARGEFVGDAPGLAAEIYTGSVVGKFVPLMLFTPHSFAIDRAQIEAHVDEVVRTFSKSYVARRRTRSSG